MDKEIIEEATEMTKGIPASDVLVPLQQPDEWELTPLPKVEYKIIEASTMDKLIRDVNAHLKNGWQTEWWVQVAAWQLTRFYQSMIRWVAREEETAFWKTNKFLESEEDLYEDIEKDATNW